MSAPEIHHGLPFWSWFCWFYLMCSAMKLFALSRLDECKGDGGVGGQGSRVTCWWSEFAARRKTRASQAKPSPGVRGHSWCPCPGEVTKEGDRLCTCLSLVSDTNGNELAVLCRGCGLGSGEHGTLYQAVRLPGMFFLFHSLLAKLCNL